MSGVNKVILVGRLGKNPETRTLDNGAKVCTFSIATSEVYKDRDGQRQEKTEWHNIVLWRNLADIAESYLAKGREVYVEGKLQTRSWDDQNGQKRYTTEIVGTNINLIGGRGDEGSHAMASETASTTSGGGSTPFDSSDQQDDLPF